MSPLGELLSEVLALQNDWTAIASTAPMQRRKNLVERDIPGWMQTQLSGAFSQWETEGSNGKGGAAEVPWSRCFDRKLSPRAGTGWYLVYLFSATGDAVYLSLNQGTTTWDVDRKDFTFRPASQLKQRVAWARKSLSNAGMIPAEAFQPIDLSARQRLGRVYEVGNVHGIRYAVDAMPTESQLRDDFVAMTQLLATLYDANAVYLPGDEPPEIADVELATEEASGNTRRRQKTGQGFRLSYAENKAIEMRAVEVATEYFVKELGYVVTYTGDKKPYDLLAEKDSELLTVEVKGTVSPGSQILLTFGEVQHHLEVYPDNALVVVHSIELDREQSPPIATGGVREVTRPWKVDEQALRPISYKYTIPTA
ncbi:DUF3578 domain-containing protein [Nocardia sp. NPDC052254]|uniref:MrcB family domain-containing protein n=1 Tax=Nocardia sp. NPDC052254 TaxID=3155681 RepID=UPI0034252C8B